MRRPVLLGLFCTFLSGYALAQALPAQRDASADVVETAVPDEARLRARIEALAAAAASRDARGIYEIVTPYIRSHMSLEEYKRDSGLDERWSQLPPTQESTALDRICGCNDWTYPDGSRTFRCVLLLSSGKGPAEESPRRPKWLAMWEYTSGDWYFGVSLEGDRCPQDAPGLTGASPPTAAEVALPDPSRLAVRMQAYYDAIVARDARVMYETQTPSARSGYSLEDYQERGGMRFNLGLVRPNVTKVVAEPAQTCSCSRFERPYPKIRCNVLVRQVQEDANGQQNTELHHDLWEYADGEWFYVVSSFGDRCAGRPATGGPPANTDRSPEAHAWRAQMLKSLMRLNVIRGVDCGATESILVVRAQFMRSSEHDKELFASFVYFYCFDGSDDTAVLRLRKESSEKTIGTFRPATGLRMH